MKKFIALLMVAILAVCCFTVNTFASYTGSISFNKYDDGYLANGETWTRADPTSPPGQEVPLWACAAVSYNSTLESQDYRSNDGLSGLVCVAIGNDHPIEFISNINSGGSGYGEAG